MIHILQYFHWFALLFVDNYLSIYRFIPSRSDLNFLDIKGWFQYRITSQNYCSEDFSNKYILKCCTLDAIRTKTLGQIKRGLYTICLYVGCVFCRCCNFDSKRFTKITSGVFLASWSLLRILGNALNFRCMPSGMRVILSSELKTVFAARGSRNIFSSANLFEGTLSTFPLSVLPWLMCPPTTSISCIIIQKKEFFHLGMSIMDISSCKLKQQSLQLSDIEMCWCDIATDLGCQGIRKRYAAS